MSILHALRNHGVDTTRERPEDAAEHGPRERRGLRLENSKAFGGRAARGAVTARVRGDALGRKDERR